MGNELRRLIMEIFFLIVFLIIVVPICVYASSDYRMMKEQYAGGENTVVDISNWGDIKKVTVYSMSNQKIKIHLILKISKFSNDYFIYLDDQIFDICDLEYTGDLENQYYDLGIYEVDSSRIFDFRLVVKDKNYYDETISYSFFTEGLL